MLVQDLPKVYNRFHSQQLETHITVEYPQGECVMSGVKTQISLEHRHNGETLTLNIMALPLSVCNVMLRVKAS